MNDLDTFVKIANFKINLKESAKKFEFDQVNNIFFKKILSEKRWLNFVLDEKHFEMWLFDEDSTQVIKHNIMYENAIKDMIFYNQTYDEVFENLMNKTLS